jgi:hypothetical protein
MGLTAATVSDELGSESESGKSSCFFRALSWLLTVALLSAVSTWLLTILLLSEYRLQAVVGKARFLPTTQLVNCQYRRKLLLRRHSPPVPAPEPLLAGEVRRTMAAARLRR